MRPRPEVSEYIWEHSTHKGSELLLLLAIARFANLDGIGWPGIPKLAKAMRMSPRNVQRLLPRLEASGELRVRRNAGPHGTHLYQIVMSVSLPLFGEQDVDIPGEILAGDNLSGVKHGPRRATKRAQRGDTATSPERLNKLLKRPAYTPPAAADLKFPKGTTEKHIGAYLAVARSFKLSRDQLQLALDEIDDRLVRGEPVHNPPLLAGAIARQIRAGTFYGVRAERHALATRGGGRPLSQPEIEHGHKHLKKVA